MPAEPVPAHKSIKRSRVGNIDSDRLTRRKDHIVDELTLNSEQFNTRIKFGLRAAELAAVENELEDRGELKSRLTTRKSASESAPRSDSV